MPSARHFTHQIAVFTQPIVVHFIAKQVKYLSVPNLLHSTLISQHIISAHILSDLAGKLPDNTCNQLAVTIKVIADY
jgi:hypothetical protein